MATDETSQTMPGQPNLPVGQQLQNAREKAGLSVNQVAAAQHLRPAIIQAIETGDHSKIDSELFLKGYVRTYAKQVGLDADALIADLDQELEPLRLQREQEQEASPLVDIERRRRRKRQFARIVFFLVALGFAGYLVFSFVLPDQEVPTAGPDSISGPEAGETEASGAGDADVPESGEVDTPESGEVEASGSDGLADSGSGEAPVPDATGADGTAATVAATDTGPEPEEPALAEPVAEIESPEAERVPAVVQSPDPALENAGELVDAVDTGRLQIEFDGDCWVQVSDAEGNRLVNSLQRSGDSIDVTGPAPLRVVIGAVDAVDSIRFQGEPVDLGGFPVANNRTEFTLTI